MKKNPLFLLLNKDIFSQPIIIFFSATLSQDISLRTHRNANKEESREYLPLQAARFVPFFIVSGHKTPVSLAEKKSIPKKELGYSRTILCTPVYFEPGITLPLWVVSS